MFRTALFKATSATIRSAVARIPVLSSPCVPAVARWNSMAVTHKNTAMMVGGLKIKSMKAENPHVDVVQYEHKNRTWTVHHVDFFAEAMAIGFIDAGLLPGDVVLSWMPEHWSEQMVLQFACSKAGMILYTLDPTLPQKDPEAAKLALKNALSLSKANVFVSPEAHEDVNYIRLVENHVIPELHDFDKAEGTVFLTPNFPHLRYPIHTGFDANGKEGWHRLQHFLINAGDLDQDWLRDRPPRSADTPLFGQFADIDEKGVPHSLGKTLTNEQVISLKVWPTYCKILEKEFHIVKGTGVVF